MTTKERPILFSGPMVRAILEGRKTQTRRIPTPTNSVFGSADKKFWDHADFSKAWVDGKGSGDEYLHVPAHGEPSCAACHEMGWYGTTHRLRFRSSPGDRLWVRETFVIENGGGEYCIEAPTDGSPFNKITVSDGEGGEQEAIEIPHFRATEPDAEIYSWACMEGDCDHNGDEDECNKTRWKPAIHMPRWASRIDLEVVKVRVERLQEISEEDAKAEGALLWPSTNFEGPHPVKLMNHKSGFFILWEKINGLKSWNANPWVWVLEFKRLRP